MKALFYTLKTRGRILKIILAVLIMNGFYSCTNVSNTPTSHIYSVIPAPVAFTPNIPHDVSLEIQQQLITEGKFNSLNEAFIVLN